MRFEERVKISENFAIGAFFILLGSIISLISKK